MTARHALNAVVVYRMLDGLRVVIVIHFRKGVCFSLNDGDDDDDVLVGDNYKCEMCECAPTHFIESIEFTRFPIHNNSCKTVAKSSIIAIKEKKKKQKINQTATSIPPEHQPKPMYSMSTPLDFKSQEAYFSLTIPTAASARSWKTNSSCPRRDIDSQSISPHPPLLYAVTMRSLISSYSPRASACKTASYRPSAVARFFLSRDYFRYRSSSLSSPSRSRTVV